MFEVDYDMHYRNIIGIFCIKIFLISYLLIIKWKLGEGKMLAGENFNLKIFVQTFSKSMRLDVFNFESIAPN